MRALNLLDDAEALKTKASELASNPDDPGSFFDDIMILLTIAHLNATMAQAYVALAELND